jgi:hypothetical protein
MTEPAFPTARHLRRSLWLGLLLGVVFLWLAFRGVETSELRRVLGRIDYQQVGIAYVLAVSGCFLRAVQWQIVLRGTRRVAVLRLFRSIMIGFFYNFLLPIRVGELVRTAYTSQEERLPFTTVLATVALTRVFDLLAILGLWAYVALFSGFSVHIEAHPALSLPVVEAGFVLATAASLAALALAAVMSLTRERSRRVVETLLDRVTRGPSPLDRLSRRVLELLADALRGLSLLRSWQHVAAAVATSLGVWLLGASVVHAVLLAFGIQLPYSASVFVLVVITLGVSVPVTPGYVGQYHAACRYALVPFGVTASKAAGVALFLHAFHFSYTGVLGGAFVMGAGRSFRRLVPSSTREMAQEPPSRTDPARRRPG